MRRVLKPAGHAIIIEPFRTPFLTFVHYVSERPLVRRLSPRLDAFAVMTEEEYPLYHEWLAQPARILEAITHEFEPLVTRTRWGKLVVLGRPRRR